MALRNTFAILADIVCAFIGVGLIRNAASLPSWADLTCTLVGLVCVWLCLARWPWEKEPTAQTDVDGEK